MFLAWAGENDPTTCASLDEYNTKGRNVRISIDIDDDLMREAMRRSGAATKKAAVEKGLRLLVQTRSQIAIRKLRGKVRWQGDLNQSPLARN
jgi:Arc/MetJ family transcription regulator